MGPPVLVLLAEEWATHPPAGLLPGPERELQIRDAAYVHVRPLPDHCSLVVYIFHSVLKLYEA